MFHFLAVILWFIRRNTYLVLDPVPGTELLKPLNFPKRWSYKGVFCHVNEVIFGEHLRMGTGCQWSQGRKSDVTSLASKNVSVHLWLLAAGVPSPLQEDGSSPALSFPRGPHLVTGHIYIPSKSRPFPPQLCSPGSNIQSRQNSECFIFYIHLKSTFLSFPRPHSH